MLYFIDPRYLCPELIIFDLEAASQHPATKVGVAFSVVHKMVSLLTIQVSDRTQCGTNTYTQGPVQRCLFNSVLRHVNGMEDTGFFSLLSLVEMKHTHIAPRA